MLKRKIFEEELKECPFSKKCSESDYGSEFTCKTDYLDCNLYHQYIENILKDYFKEEELK